MTAVATFCCSRCGATSGFVSDAPVLGCQVCDRKPRTTLDVVPPGLAFAQVPERVARATRRERTTATSVVLRALDRVVEDIEVMATDPAINDTRPPSDEEREVLRRMDEVSP